MLFVIQIINHMILKLEYDRDEVESLLKYIRCHKTLEEACKSICVEPPKEYFYENVINVCQSARRDSALAAVYFLKREA